MRSDFIALGALLACGAASAQEAPTATPRPVWASARVAPSRAATAACFVEQQLALRLASAAPDAAPLSLSVRLDVAGRVRRR